MFVVGVITISYFAIVNGTYLVFMVIAWRSLSSHLRGRTHSAVEKAFNSPFTPGITVIQPAYNEAAGIVDRPASGSWTSAAASGTCQRPRRRPISR
jgi:hypothetical protein